MVVMSEYLLWVAAILFFIGAFFEFFTFGSSVTFRADPNIVSGTAFGALGLLSMLIALGII